MKHACRFGSDGTTVPTRTHLCIVPKPSTTVYPNRHSAHTSIASNPKNRCFVLAGLGLFRFARVPTTTFHDSACRWGVRYVDTVLPSVPCVRYVGKGPQAWLSYRRCDRHGTVDGFFRTARLGPSIALYFGRGWIRFDSIRFDSCKTKERTRMQ